MTASEQILHCVGRKTAHFLRHLPGSFAFRPSKQSFYVFACRSPSVSTREYAQNRLKQVVQFASGSLIFRVYGLHSLLISTRIQRATVGLGPGQPLQGGELYNHQRGGLFALLGPIFEESGGLVDHTGLAVAWSPHDGLFEV